MSSPAIRLGDIFGLDIARSNIGDLLPLQDIAARPTTICVS